ncbi:hypothetical protein A3G06_01130 [Candidatus Nomurabacteria bacterium RIFCSPLOWO2_12_FULL_46_14]|uniref:AI-2E family transporter n=1 Tax=Candidatus Nomurabacteria bacterium RIFCSPLOWO2_12_FULL_46_14 TaxID=1801797 RepID=A0A1F6Y8I8_9BACT|nr:MAG: hypothetical protein A3G06_01130 [Candidatus Nomurabacteria bacterium RIFCSPLOWO2_12_FULL_46_14]
MQTKIIERYFFFGLLLATFIFTFLIFRPFWVVLVLGISFSIVLYPLYESLTQKRAPSWLAALITLLFFIIVLVGPLLVIGNIVFNQSQDLYQTVAGSKGSFLQSVENSINQILPRDMAINVNQKASDLIYSISDNIAKIFETTLTTLFSFILMLLSIFYFLKDGAKWRKSLIVLSPLADKDDEKIIERLAIAVNGVMRGYLLIAIVQGALMGIGLFIFGVPNPALWGVVAAVASLIPTIGTALVSVPAIIFLFAIGETGQAIGLLVWASIAVGTIDNFLAPYVVGRKVNISPLLMLFAVLGGLSFLGPVGILVGPLTLSLLYTLISIYRSEFKPAL